MISMGMIVLLATLGLILAVLGLYWLPSILAYRKRHPDLFAVVVINALLGWTIIGWIIALARSQRPVRPAAGTPTYLPGFGSGGRGAAFDDL